MQADLAQDPRLAQGNKAGLDSSSDLELIFALM